MIRLAAARDPQTTLLPDLTPLLDVIFIVLVFFLLTAQTPLLELPMQLPQSQEDLATAAGGAGRIEVALAVEGSWRFNGVPQEDFNALRGELLAAFATASRPGVDLALDRRAPLSAFLDLIALLQQQGIQDSRILFEVNHATP